MRYIIAAFTLLMIMSCSSSQTTTTADAKAKKSAFEILQEKPNLELIDYLKTKSGLQITGNSPNYKILIRGYKTVEGSQEPLYVINGDQRGRSYNQASYAVDVYKITKVTILPATRAAGKYGDRGGNGVIEITSEK